MSARKVHVTFTQAEAEALWSMADTLGSDDRAMLDTLGSGASVAAGWRAADKLKRAMHHEPPRDRRTG